MNRLPNMRRTGRASVSGLIKEEGGVDKVP
jgi:hypothetical protein